MSSRSGCAESRSISISGSSMSNAARRRGPRRAARPWRGRRSRSRRRRWFQSRAATIQPPGSCVTDRGRVGWARRPPVAYTGTRPARPPPVRPARGPGPHREDSPCSSDSSSRRAGATTSSASTRRSTGVRSAAWPSSPNSNPFVLHLGLRPRAPSAPPHRGGHHDVTLMAARRVTGRIRLGQMCTCMGYRNPGLPRQGGRHGQHRLREAATRWASAPTGTSASGAPTATASRAPVSALQALREGVEIMREIKETAGRSTYAGERFTTDGAVLPAPAAGRLGPRSPHNGIPMWVAGGGETLRIAAEYADYTNFSGMPEDRRAVLRGHCAMGATTTRSCAAPTTTSSSAATRPSTSAWAGSATATPTPAARQRRRLHRQVLRGTALVGTPSSTSRPWSTSSPGGMRYAITSREQAYDISASSCSSSRSSSSSSRSRTATCRTSCTSSNAHGRFTSSACGPPSSSRTPQRPCCSRWPGARGARPADLVRAMRISSDAVRPQRRSRVRDRRGGRGGRRTGGAEPAHRRAAGVDVLRPVPPPSSSPPPARRGAVELRLLRQGRQPAHVGARW